MGSLCSKPSTLTGGHQVVDSSTTGQGQRNNAPDARVAALEAAERRLKAQQTRGTSKANPNQGQLASKLEASKTAAKLPEQRQEERVVWD